MIVPATLDWSSIDTVLLDMDGTLLDLHFDSYFWLEHLPVRYADIHQMDAKAAREWLHQRIMQEQGTLNWYCLDYWSRELNVDIVALKAEVADRIAFRPHVQGFLQQVREAGLRSVIVTNAHRGSLSLKLARTDLADRVDAIVCSHDFGVPKEEQIFWSTLQEVEPFNPQRTLLIDDSLAVLASAKQYGIRYLLAIRQPDSQSPIRDINEFGAVDQFNELVPRGLKDV
ncbi:putative hydrolase of the HAD superfamily [Neptunomonas antarctica]|uniref:Putative hydrolase of the HAD superfamily n=2 Tax=Neptunomonas antarctica TaxID=619304 RepID=A0A1N7MKS6_9GAMM|nr:GMP/IMP nucleotidase [Neptunomonas antarctica]SIS86622.1 putative hydrolase of the HAD superfamily [Neptunomonas antarctica]